MTPDLVEVESCGILALPDLGSHFIDRLESPNPKHPSSLGVHAGVRKLHVCIPPMRGFLVIIHVPNLAP